MKKIVKVSALALLAMGLVFNFASCSNGDDDSGSGDQDVEVTPSGNNETTTTDTTTTTALTGTATITYTGTTDESVPTSAGTSGFFKDVQEAVAGGYVSDKFGGLKDGYPKFETCNYTWTSTNTKQDSTGICIAGTTDDSTKPALSQGDVVGYLDYKFTLAAEASVSVDVSAFNTQSGNLGGQIVILSGTSAVATGSIGSGSKEAMSATLAATKLAAGTYTLRFNWAAVSDLAAGKGIKNMKGGISSFTITASN